MPWATMPPSNEQLAVHLFAGEQVCGRLLIPCWHGVYTAGRLVDIGCCAVPPRYPLASQLALAVSRLLCSWGGSSQHAALMRVAAALKLSC